MSQRFLFCLIFLTNIVNAQDNVAHPITPTFFNLIINANNLGHNIEKYSTIISEWSFDGDYSFDRIYGNPFTIDSITGDTIGYRTTCTVPIKFELPLYKVLMDLDSSYDSLYYVNQIKSQKIINWKKTNFKFQSGFNLLGWPFLKINKRYYTFSNPIFSKDQNIAIVEALHQTREPNRFRRNDKIYIFKKESGKWNIIKVIPALKYSGYQPE